MHAVDWHRKVRLACGDGMPVQALASLWTKASFA